MYGRELCLGNLNYFLYGFYYWLSVTYICFCFHISFSPSQSTQPSPSLHHSPPHPHPPPRSTFSHLDYCRSLVLDSCLPENPEWFLQNVNQILSVLWSKFFRCGATAHRLYITRGLTPSQPAPHPSLSRMLACLFFHDPNLITSVSLHCCSFCRE